MALSAPSIYRIGLDARFYRRGTAGIGTYTRQLIAHLAEIDTTNHYSVFLTPEDAAEWDLTQSNFHPIVVPIPHYTVKEQLSFHKVLKKEKLDLVHFLNYNHPVLYRKPFVTTIQDLTVYLFPTGKKQKSPLKRMAFIAVMKDALKRSKKIIAISEHTAQDVAQHFGVSQAKMEVIHLGGPEIGRAIFHDQGVVDEYLRSDAPYFLFVSAWRPHKGLLTLIQAFNDFKERTKLSHKLVLVGNQSVADMSIKEAIASSPFTQDIITPGFVPEDLLPSLYHYATAYILASEYEGFGLMTLEAFAYQAPVISADNSSLPEVGGNAVLYFPTGNSMELSAQMEYLATDPVLAKELIEKGVSQAKKFSWGKCAEQTLAIYKSILEKKR